VYPATAASFISHRGSQLEEKKRRLVVITQYDSQRDL